MGRAEQRFGTSAQKRRILAAQGYLCFYCHETLAYEDAVLDHKVPWRDGGQTTDDNLVACHRAENKAKANMRVEEFLALHQDSPEALKTGPSVPDVAPSQVGGETPRCPS